MKYLKLFEEFGQDSKFYYYKVKKGQEVIIRNDTMGKPEYKISSSPLESLLEDMGGVDSIKTDFPVKGKLEPFAIDFAMNACLFEPGGGNTGYYRFYGKDIASKNNSETDNFGMHLDENSGERNGVFYGGGDKWGIVGTSEFNFGDKSFKFAIQNGPILTLDGKINSIFEAHKDSKNKTNRGGIGVDKDGLPCFVISKGPVSFYELSEFFLNSMKCPNSIYTDGTISQAYIRKNYTKYVGSITQDLGPIILVTM
jgi:uncharacterized protein YigE (DUF2233 family)